MPKKRTYENVKEFIKTNNDILLSDSYKNCHEQLKIQCHCGNIYKISFNKYQHGDRCSCQKEKINYTYDGIKKYISKFGYKLLSTEYKNQYDKLKLECNNNHKYEVSFKHFKNGSRCPYCYKEATYITRDYVEEYLNQYGYKLVGEYKDTQSYINTICPNGHDFKIKFCSFKYNNNRCAKCNGTNGEKEIMRILDSYNVDYNYQHKFDDCKIKLPLPFDFYLKNINTIIEYDGQIHYEPIECFGGEEFYHQVKNNDNIKNDYCNKNNINLIRIPYWDFKNIESILKLKNVI